MTEYRQIYNKAKSELAKRHNPELHSIMKELGYVRKERVLKAKDTSRSNGPAIVTKEGTEVKKVEVKK